MRGDRSNPSPRGSESRLPASRGPAPPPGRRLRRRSLFGLRPLRSGPAAIALGLAGAGAALAAAVACTCAVRRRRAIDFAGRAALVTGGSRGLGLCIAEELARQGARVAIVARDPDELAAAARRLSELGGEPVTIAADLRDTAQAERALDEAVERLGRLDLLVNNAGLITVGPLSEMTPADFDEQMAIHFRAPLHLSLAALPHLQRSGAGRIVNVASIGGRIAVPHMAPYSASKAALVGLSDALRAELAARGVAVTTVCPGLMRTGSHLHARFKGDRRSERTWFTVGALAPLVTLDAESAARRIVEAARRGDAYLTFNRLASLAIRAEGLAPGLTRRISGLAARAMPSPIAAADGEAKPGWPGWKVRPRWLPGPLRRRGERVAARHLETVSAGEGAVGA